MRALLAEELESLTLLRIRAIAIVLARLVGRTGAVRRGSLTRRIAGAIFRESRPATIIRSDWRGEPRNTSAPKRAMS
mgnify:CR=1 FL=1